MRRLWFIVFSLLLLSGCGLGDGNALFPELKGRWAPEKGVRARLSLASNNSSVPVVPPSLKELFQSEYVTFEKSGSEGGAVMLHRDGGRQVAFVVVSAKRDSARITLTGREQGQPFAGSGQARIELVLRNGEIAFNNVFDQRGRSVRYDHLKVPDTVRAQRAGLTTIGDLFRVLFDLKSCTA